MYVKFCKTVKTTQNPVRHCFVPVPDRFSIPFASERSCHSQDLQMRVVWLNMIFIRNLFNFSMLYSSNFRSLSIRSRIFGDPRPSYWRYFWIASTMPMLLPVISMLAMCEADGSVIVWVYHKIRACFPLYQGLFIVAVLIQQLLCRLMKFFLHSPETGFSDVLLSLCPQRLQ